MTDEVIELLLLYQIIQVGPFFHHGVIGPVFLHADNVGVARCRSERRVAEPALARMRWYAQSQRRLHPPTGSFLPQLQIERACGSTAWIPEPLSAFRPSKSSGAVLTRRYRRSRATFASGCFVQKPTRAETLDVLLALVEIYEAKRWPRTLIRSTCTATQSGEGGLEHVDGINVDNDVDRTCP
jgi:hypothetical protein